MNELASKDAYGVLTEPATLKIQRLLPGPVERIWAYLTKSDLRRQWLAAGDMELRKGAPIELVWRNDELSDPPGVRPDGFREEQRMTSKVIDVDPPHRLVIAWEGGGDVSFDLEEKGRDVLLTIIHTRLANREARLMIGAGWHMHLDILAARATGRKPAPFWDGWSRLRKDYDKRMPA